MPSPLRASSSPEPLLIAAVTGRPLAASARRGGYAAAVLDLFADANTRALGYPCRNVCRGDALRFDAPRLLAAADELAPRGRCAGVVFGSGFESSTRLMARLARGRPSLCRFASKRTVDKQTALPDLLPGREVARFS